MRDISKSDDDGVEREEQVKGLGKKVYGVTVRCGASLLFASIGAGIGATLFRPSTGQSVGKYQPSLQHCILKNLLLFFYFFFLLYLYVSTHNNNIDTFRYHYE